MLSYETYFSEWELFLLVFVRLATFIYAAPFFNTANTPRRIKVAFAFFLTIITVSLYPDMEYTYTGVLGYATLVIKEAAVGLIIGVFCNFVLQIIHFAGRFIDMDIGLSMASVMDPTNRTQNGIVGSIYYYIVLLLLIASDMHRYIISAIVETYRFIPVGQISPNVGLYGTVLEFISNYISIGFRIALPVFACMLIVNTILGIMAKVAPQMNMFVVGMQIKIVFGLGVLLFVVYMLPAVSNVLYETIKNLIYNLVQGMMP